MYDTKSGCGFGVQPHYIAMAEGHQLVVRNWWILAHAVVKHAVARNCSVLEEPYAWASKDVDSALV